MKVLLLGGYGQFGLPTARQLVRYDFIDEVVLAGRSLDKARKAASDVGSKATALQLDADDSAAVERALREIDAMVSFMWDEGSYQKPILGAAIRAGSHYCNLRSRPPTPELDAAARAAGVTALIGVGSHPGLLGMTDKLAFTMLDEVDTAVSGMLWTLLQGIWDDLYRAYIPLPGALDRGPHGGELRTTLGAPADSEARLAAIRDGRVVEMWLSTLSRGEPLRVEIPALGSAGLGVVDPLEAGVDMPLDRPEGGFASVPVISLPPPGEFDEVPHIHLSIAGFAQDFSDLLRGVAAQLRTGEIEFDAAVASVRERIELDLAGYLLDPALFAAMPGYFMSVYGRKDGRPARAATWVSQPYYTERNWLDLTAANVAISVARLLRGDIDAPGAHVMIEVDSLDEAFVAELASRLPDVPEGVPLIGRRLEFL